ncbi:hypothetical protein [Mesorhizobium sp. CN2-181]|uniref:hypothetical protein n=1 Tax=Mesorhizobium yinganensis TaxID=3157707 RepID=UPI0032B7E612
MEKTITTITTDKARQGRTGLQVLFVLIISLLLAGVVWGGVAIWGETIDAPAADAPGGLTAPAQGTGTSAN